VKQFRKGVVNPTRVGVKFFPFPFSKEFLNQVLHPGFLSTIFMSEFLSDPIIREFGNAKKEYNKQYNISNKNQYKICEKLYVVYFFYTGKC
jgi:hypothetical protein